MSEYDALIEAGTIDPPTRKTRSDKGSKKRPAGAELVSVAKLAKQARTAKTQTKLAVGGKRVALAAAAKRAQSFNSAKESATTSSPIPPHAPSSPSRTLASAATSASNSSYALASCPPLPPAGRATPLPSNTPLPSESQASSFASSTLQSGSESARAALLTAPLAATTTGWNEFQRYNSPEIPDEFRITTSGNVDAFPHLFNQNPPAIPDPMPFGQGTPPFGLDVPGLGQGMPLFGHGAPLFGQGAPSLEQSTYSFDQSAHPFSQGAHPSPTTYPLNRYVPSPSPSTPSLAPSAPTTPRRTRRKDPFVVSTPESVSNHTPRRRGRPPGSRSVSSVTSAAIASPRLSSEDAIRQTEWVIPLAVSGSSS
ncbi:hypothetical protein FRC12_008578 [Ceratobasidium sp. 428]|nr:hypothetical protein FRC12_008578 [Ceratobasidium sp. 428]